MHIQTIHKALRTLDPNDDDHWTSDHAPRLDVLEPLLPGVTREHLRKAAPLFTRINPELPDLDAERASAEEAMRVAQDAERAADAAKKEALAKQEKVKSLESEIRDRHTLTRQNRGWIQSQIEADRARAAHQAKLDEAVKNAGGMAMIGAHPVERNMAARIRQQRRNIVVKTPQKTG